MTQEDKKLLLKDLCARLLYGVNVSVKSKNEFINSLCSIDINGICEVNDDFYKIDNIKPYLFPLSSMTEEQLFEVQSILGKNEVKIENDFIRIVNSKRNTFSYLELEALFNWFNANHFDHRGLIKKGLAIDATNLNIY